MECSPLPIYAIAFITSILIHRHLKSRHKISKKNKKMHIQILKVINGGIPSKKYWNFDGLLLQFTMPARRNCYQKTVGSCKMKSDFSRSWYALNQESQYIEKSDLEMGGIILAASPIITLFSEPPYRRLVPIFKHFILKT